jgi:hypothetical protein
LKITKSGLLIPLELVPAVQRALQIAAEGRMPLEEMEQEEGCHWCSLLVVRGYLCDIHSQCQVWEEMAEAVNAAEEKATKAVQAELSEARDKIAVTLEAA